MGKFSQFKLQLNTLSPGVHSFEYHLDKTFFANMESEDVRDANLDVQLTVEAKHDTFLLQFAIKGTVTVACDRCLDDLVLEIDAPYKVMVKYGEDYCDDSDEVIEIPQSEQYLNVAYMIYDTVSLAIPVKHVHPLGKCNRAMSSLLKKHRAQVPGDADTELEEELIDEMDSIDDTGDADETDGAATDSRWDKLKDLK